ncbi:MAG: dethiobiotin synthase [Xanthomonadales bacterium]|nr:dethiobiotin synthase [Xanthomonadales bacterium]
MRRWFITGTDTGIGKTHAGCVLARALIGEGLRVAALKPVASGCERTPDGLRNEDALAWQAAANVPLGYDTVNPYAFEPPIAPHIAARQAGVTVDPARIEAIAQAIEVDVLLVEGAGGWCVPLGPGLTFADLAGRVCDGVILIVGLKLGCLNHALLTARAIRQDGQRLVGWIANRVDPDMAVAEDNLAHLRASLGAPLLGIVAHGGTRLEAARLDVLLNPT